MVFYGFFQRLVIPVAVQKDRGLWERDCSFCSDFVKGVYARKPTRETRAVALEEKRFFVPLPSRAFSVARGHFCVLRVSVDGLRKPRDCS